ncbi:S49 family peptidase [Phenylobacterium kunshanense]|uniref:S49 family peptidase n=2 Tax=Phenylobacterium kunshanense TaxID=1445034 RepID=A0A328BGH2_9CAUL|nr:S49 family peptidase [Phenylobacterium kunshanense]
MNGLMAVVHGLDRSKGLEFILHTPGGGIEAARAMVEYLYQMFGKDIRVIVPHMAMSAGTMIACAAREIMMGKHSCLGPTDPQVRGYPAMGVLAEAERAVQEIKKEPLKQIVWQQVFAKYPPGFITDCERQVLGAKAMVTQWLRENMVSGEADPGKQADAIVDELMNYAGQSGHGQHYVAGVCKQMGLKIVDIEADQAVQEDVLSVHHTFVATFARTGAIKLIENASGGSWDIST